MLQRNIDNGKLNGVLFVELMYYCTSYYRLANAAVHPQCFNFLVFIGQIDYSVLGGVELSHKI